MTFDVDQFLKRYKEQRALGVAPGEEKVCSCGRTIYPYPATGDDYDRGEVYVYENFCNVCMTRAIVNSQRRMETAPKEKKKKPTCRFCWKPRRLVGAWCRTCRNNHQRRIIKAALAKVEKGEALTWEDEQTLAMAPYWPVWKKEFRKVALVRK